MPKTSVSVGQPEGKSSSSKDGALPKPKLNRKSSSPLRKPIPLRKRPISPLRKRPISPRVRTASQSRKSPSPLAIQPALVKKEFLPSNRRASLAKRYVAYKPIGVSKPGSSSTARDGSRRGRSRDQNSKRHRSVSRKRSPQRNSQHISHAKPPSLRLRSPSPMDISPDRSPRKVIQNVSTNRRVTPQMFPSKNATKSTWEAPVEVFVLLYSIFCTTSEGDQKLKGSDFIGAPAPVNVW